MRTQLALTAAVFSSVLASSVVAQQIHNAGFGHAKRSFNASVQSTRDDQNLIGVGYLPANNGVHGVTHGARIYMTGPAGRVYVMENDGTFVRRPRDPAIRFFASTTGTTDMANDGVATVLGGSDVGVVCFEGDRATLVTTVQAANGPQTIVNPIAGPGLATLREFRGVGYDPTGNNGNGSLFVGNNAGVDPILEIDLSGNVLNTFPNDDGSGGRIWTCNGLVVDTGTGNLWVNTGALGDIIELDRSNQLQATGAFFRQHRRGGVRGGIDRIDGGDPLTDPSRMDILVMNRVAGDDHVSIHRIQSIQGANGTEEPILEGSVNGAAFSTGASPDTPGNLGRLRSGDTFAWRLSPGRGSSTAAGLCFINIGRNALVDGATTFPWVLPELRAQWPLSVPASPAGLQIACSVGGAPTQVTIPAGIISCFNLFKVQAMYLELAKPQFPPLIATNEIWANFADEAGCNIVVEATGPDSNNSGLANQPFWQVHHKGGPGISEVSFSFTDSNNELVRTALDFHVNWPFGRPPGQPQAFFLAGNGNFPVCQGTYRGSDVTTGLVYDALNDLPDPCNINGNSGVISGGGTSSGSSFSSFAKKVTFRFTNFNGGTASNPVSFVFDVETDWFGFTPGSENGGAMAGTMVFVTLENGVQLATELRPDRGNPERSVGGL